MNKNIFLFVVCGAKEHIDTLHFSLKYLQKYSKNEIWVVTDSSRNEIPIDYEKDKIIDITTPKEFNHHQASIYLKTGIHRFVPKGNKYCYLDTDVIALSEEVDKIFEEYVAPITFAADHFSIPHFSVYALNCGCLEQLKKYEEYIIKFKEALNEIESLVEETKKTNYYWIRKILYHLPIKYYYLNSQYKLNKKQNIWYNAKNQRLILDDFLISNGLPPKIKNQCSHLQEVIDKEYCYKINDSWNHFNGGVFLFDDHSHEFLESWHQLTLEKFNDNYWRTRDQGTLIITTWKFGLENHPILEQKWNFIADSKNEALDLDEKTDFFTENNWKTKIKPNFIHVFYRFGDTTWKIWNYILTK